VGRRSERGERRNSLVPKIPRDISGKD